MAGQLDCSLFYKPIKIKIDLCRQRAGPEERVVIKSRYLIHPSFLVGEKIVNFLRYALAGRIKIGI